MAAKKDVTQLSTRELIEYVNRIEKISTNPAILKTLHDKGAKVKAVYHKAKLELSGRDDLAEVTESMDKLTIQKIEFGSNAIWCHFNGNDSDDDDDDDIAPMEVKKEEIPALKRAVEFKGSIDDSSAKRMMKTVEKDPEKVPKYAKTNNPYQETFPLYNFDKLKALDMEESLKLINEHRTKLKEAEETLKVKYMLNTEIVEDFT